MKLKTVQWNINGGKIRSVEADPTLDSSYVIDDQGYYAARLKAYVPDIVALQETHTDETEEVSGQISYFADQLGLPYFINVPFSPSHIEAGKKLGNAILSRWPLSATSFEVFFNPRPQRVLDSGEIAVAHDKGVVRAVLDVDGQALEVMSVHLMPFHRFNFDLFAPEQLSFIEDMAGKIKPKEMRALIQGDFNLDCPSLGALIPQFVETVSEVALVEPTFCRGGRFDHILYRGLYHVSTEIDRRALSDHYPLYSEFEL
ncbi:MAG: hypothetical protein UY92_C0005G0030 [Candidatus Magasanikbacteria bacterium GW2011_GWA2_56_11]|uniref:Endonuclease/exonuclease/phosphatase domain-containing protein n=1 Tax=Candidatus Magasanikbacteria bacterium GW2011_GWA2_56_11 TaxID=1619044 RepID=A0A0G1YGR8_9BACT|nr:MAG: hypothetical protein UY92_C0005G0030 [Candidatus Magasanikbacteria bacterium GW2011_GWA2_56_11]